jgi:PKD repeat protein
VTVTVFLVGVNLPPVASASANRVSGVAPLAVSFFSTNSADPEGSSLTYTWSFGDGTTSTSANPVKTYNNAGVYLAQLTVRDGTNTSAPSVVTISVGSPATGLVAAYGFDEGLGAAALDVSGNGNNGTVTGASWTSNSRFGKALSFGGSSLVTVADSASLDLSSGMTLEAWVNPVALNGSWMNVIFKANGDPGSANPAYLLQGCSAASSAPSVYINGAPSNLAASSPLPLNTWSHIAATYDGATIRFFVNGLLVASRAQTGAIIASSDVLTIGGNAYSGQNWAGLIDEVRIYNRALSPVEIHKDMNIPVAGTNAPPPAPQNFRLAGS